MECEIVCGGIISKEFASVMRYLLLPEVLLVHSSVLVVDVDSIINEPIDIPSKYDLGLFLRGNQDIRKKVMGSCFYITDRAMEFAEQLKMRLDGETQWFDDQIAIYKLYQKHLGRYKVKLFGANFINWHCEPAPIWTGKGDIKSENEVFLHKLKKYNDLHRI